jgi:hypothetical protein
MTPKQFDPQLPTPQTLAGIIAQLDSRDVTASTEVEESQTASHGAIENSPTNQDLAGINLFFDSKSDEPD